jgi:bifunctional ADP-heptose synthase (sugar kinase/adenylyltransferase)
MSKTVLVVGDEMQDLWVEGAVERQSPEAPEVPVVKVKEQRMNPGGAGNVKANLLALGVDAKIAKHRAEGPLPVKARVVADGRQLCRVDFNDQCQPFVWRDFADIFRDQVYEAVVVSDYGKGAVTAETRDALRCFLSPEMPVFVDTKGNPAVWMGLASVLFPNLREYEAWRAEYDRFPNVILKAGQDGIVRLMYGEPVQYEPGLEVDVQSVSGAGDSVLAGFVAAYLDGASLEASTAFANRCGAASVSQPGTTAVSKELVAHV